MIQEGNKYIIKETFGQSGWDLKAGWMFTAVKHVGSQWSCQFDQQYHDYAFHDCCGDTLYGFGFYVYSHLIEEHCDLLMETREPSWEL